MEGRLSSVLLGPIASFWCGDFSVGACFLQRYIRDFRIVSKESSAVRTRRDRKVLFGKAVQLSHLGIKRNHSAVQDLPTVGD
jgi:hypothetical protein